MAEYFLTLPTRVSEVPGNVSDEEAALIEPLGTGVSGVAAAGLKYSDSAVSFGSGPELPWYS